MTLLEVLDLLVRLTCFLIVCLGVAALGFIGAATWERLMEKRCKCRSVALRDGLESYNLSGVRHSRWACWPARESIDADRR